MTSTILLGAITFLCVLLSLVRDRQKTREALKRAFLLFMNLLPPFLTVLALVSVLLYLITPGDLAQWLGKESGFRGMLLAAFIGSVSLIPGLIAYPLGKILIDSGVAYPVLAIFITTLMMVGFITLPIEKKFFGLKTALLRNGLSFAGAIIIGLIMGLFWRMA